MNAVAFGWTKTLTMSKIDDPSGFYTKNNRPGWEVIGWILLALLITYMTIEFLDWLGLVQLLFERPLR